MEKLKLLHNSEIDLEKWDRVLHQASNSRIYAESWFLDVIAPDWQGLIYGDYEYVMPLIAGKKYGITYIYQPTYAQQHGVFPESDIKINQLFVSFLQSRFRYYNIAFNPGNNLNSISHKKIERSNYVLPLNDAYVTLARHFSKHAKRYIKKAHKNVDVLERISGEEYMRLKNQFASNSYSKKNHKTLKLLMTKSMNKGHGIIYGAYTRRNELCAAAFFLRERHRLTYLNSVSTDEGKKDRAMYAIIDKFIKDYQGSGFVLDFEGSNIEGIARFFKGFGAKHEAYYLLTYNSLPWYLKLLKR